MVDDSPYLKRELDEKFIEMRDQLDRIEEQTLKTNGSVARVITEQIEIKLKQAKQDGFNSAAIWFGGIFSTVFLAVMGWLLLQVINTPQQINMAVQQALSVYDIQK